MNKKTKKIRSELVVERNEKYGINNPIEQEPYYMYVIVRNDLSPEQKAVQSCHAALEASRFFMEKYHKHPHLILLSIKNLDKLKQLIKDLKEEKVKFKYFVEPDKNNEITALATQCFKGKQEMFSNFKLLRYGLKNVIIDRILYRY